MNFNCRLTFEFDHKAVPGHGKRDLGGILRNLAEWSTRTPYAEIFSEDWTVGRHSPTWITPYVKMTIDIDDPKTEKVEDPAELLRQVKSTLTKLGEAASQVDRLRSYEHRSRAMDQDLRGWVLKHGELSRHLQELLRKVK